MNKATPQYLASFMGLGAGGMRHFPPASSPGDLIRLKASWYYGRPRKPRRAGPDQSVRSYRRAAVKPAAVGQERDDAPVAEGVVSGACWILH